MRVGSWVAAVAVPSAFLALLVTSTGCNDSKLAGENPVIDVSPSTIVFDATAPGATNTKVATVTNHGGGTLLVSDIQITGANATDFSADSSAAGAFPIALGPGEWFAVQVTFAPGAAGDHQAVMSVLSNDPATPQKDVPLQTVGLAGNLDASPNPLNMTAQTNQSSTGAITLSNTGTADLTISGAALGPATSTFFTLGAATWPQTLAPGDSTTLSVTFAPTSNAAAAGSVDITSDDPDSPTTSVALNGNGVTSPVPDINAVPNPLNFGDVQRLTCSTKTTQVQNVGTAPLVVSNITRGFLTSQDWTFTPTNFTVQPGASQALSVTFCPSNTGYQLGGLSIASNDPDENPYNLTITGNGTPPPLSETDISVKLEWDTNDTDIDTHLWRGSGAYKANPGDCYYADCVTLHPDWGVAGDHSDDPYLDTDDVDGFGPENLNLSNAATDNYTIAIFYYSDHGHSGPSNAKVTVYLNGTQVWQGTKSLSNNDLWTIMKVNWNHGTDSGTYTLTDTVTSASPFAPEQDDKPESWRYTDLAKRIF